MAVYREAKVTISNMGEDSFNKSQHFYGSPSDGSDDGVQPQNGWLLHGVRHGSVAGLYVASKRGHATQPLAFTPLRIYSTHLCLFLNLKCTPSNGHIYAENSVTPYYNRFLYAG